MTPTHETLAACGLQWHTFAVDGSENIYVTGYSDFSWTGPSGEPPLHANSGGRDLFVLKHSI
jgi:hypothetical protein